MDQRLLSVAKVANLLGCSQRGVWRYRDAGRMPAAISLGRLVRWRQTDIEAWIADGCPDVKRRNWTPSTACTGACAGKGGHHA